MTWQSGKSATGIEGLDEILEGGLPRGRSTLIAGGSGCGKSIFGQSIIAYGAAHCEEPGIILSFEEAAREVVANSSLVGADLQALIDSKKLVIDEIDLDLASTRLDGVHANLGGIFARIEYALQQVQAKRILLDSIEALFSLSADRSLIRAEVRRLLRWLKQKGLTVIVTGEKGEGQVTRFGFEDYLMDCVIFADHRVTEQLSTRRLRVIKYRGSRHATDEFPFVITDEGIRIVPVTSLNLDYEVTSEILTTGIPTLDSMLGGGVYDRSTILVEGTSGTGKTSIAACFATHLAASVGKVLYVSFEESPKQLERNMESIGVRLRDQVERGMLDFHAFRPASSGLESHLASIESRFRSVMPRAVILDPISALVNLGDSLQIYSMLCRLLDLFRRHGAVVMLTSLKKDSGSEPTSQTAGMSSVVDSWIELDHVCLVDRFEIRIRVVKARGMPRRNEIANLRIRSDGISIDGIASGI